jgi:hypothetical protein
MPYVNINIQGVLIIIHKHKGILVGGDQAPPPPPPIGRPGKNIALKSININFLPRPPYWQGST